ncbi:excalibur calcium-binding domain-containing protein [Paenibacillus timonensis]|uniref:excalibur calcium-binding domain-containing protein n=1 Tax=Paenibacillus timonensis TaxID=225915 RepID=UPI003F97B7ED
MLFTFSETAATTETKSTDKSTTSTNKKTTTKSEQKTVTKENTSATSQETAASTDQSGVYYKNCTAVREAGAAPLYEGDPGYSTKLDRDKDGVACE